MSDLADLLQYIAVRPVRITHLAGLIKFTSHDPPPQLKVDCQEHDEALRSIVPGDGQTYRIVRVFGGPMVTDAKTSNGTEPLRHDCFMAWPA